MKAEEGDYLPKGEEFMRCGLRVKERKAGSRGRKEVGIHWLPALES